MSNDKFDFSSLDKEFGLTTTPNSSHEVDFINDMRSQLPTVQDLPPDPDDILYKNIERANKILDKLEESILLGDGVNARLIEVYGQILNSITSASTSLSGNTFAQQKHEYNMKLVEVKQQEVEVKRIVAGTKLAGLQESKGDESRPEKVLVMDRESLLKMIAEEKAGVHVKSHQTKE
jgi:hypothetical protein